MSDDNQPADNQDVEPVKHWSLLREDVAVVVWTSFLVASLFTMFFFAFVDPDDLTDILGYPWWLPNTMTTYALGFFGFWVLAALAGALTAYMIDTSHEHSDHVIEREEHKSKEQP
jgi:hypothetical protein